ncbi:Gfo/Idh/MocA family oxidoreductase [Planktomarina temperata]|nr:Gfo/Idh/MocA family oxidoreductase [Planktomarina temperata]
MAHRFQTKKIRVAIVGIGRIAANHINAILQFPNTYEIVAICDKNKEKLEAFDALNNTKKYEALENMLESETLDLLVVTSPSGYHRQHAIAAAERGIDVLCEKPMATRLDHAIEMIEASERNNTRLYVVKQNRFNPTIERLKSAIQERRFGKIHMVNVNVFWTRPQTYYDQDASWRGRWDLDGGALMNQASHYVDLMSWLIGPVDTINAFTTTYRTIEAEDTAVVNIKWRNGALGALSVSMLTFPKNLEGSISIFGETGSAKVGGSALNKIEHWKFNEEKPEDLSIDQHNYETSSVYGNGHSVVYARLKDALLGRDNSLPDGREGLKSLELIIAAYRSARDSRNVGLPLNV